MTNLYLDGVFRGQHALALVVGRLELHFGREERHSGKFYTYNVHPTNIYTRNRYTQGIDSIIGRMRQDGLFLTATFCLPEFGLLTLLSLSKKAIVHMSASLHCIYYFWVAVREVA